MSENPSKMLEVLFAIEPQVISRDLCRAKDDIRAIIKEIALLRELPTGARSPEIEAQCSHLIMVQAHELCRLDVIAPEVQTFYAAFGAGHIAQAAEMISADRDTCAELAAKMRDIRRREGLAEDEFWIMKDEGPQDYRDLDDEICGILERVVDTVFSYALRRYQLDRHADLFERDRSGFEIQREIGRRILMPAEEAEAGFEKIMDESFRREYGSSAFEHVLARVKEIRSKGFCS